MVHLAIEAASAPIGHPAPVCGFAPDVRPYRLHRNGYGSPRWYQRWLEAWWILTGEWSLHRAWQAGQDLGRIQEYRRVVINGGDLIPIIDCAILAALASTPNGSLPSDETFRQLRAATWDRYRRRPSTFGKSPDFSSALEATAVPR